MVDTSLARVLHVTSGSFDGNAAVEQAWDIFFRFEQVRPYLEGSENVVSNTVSVGEEVRGRQGKKSGHHVTFSTVTKRHSSVM